MPEQAMQEMEGGGMNQEFLDGARAGAGPEGRGSHVIELLEGEGVAEADPEMVKQLDTINGAMVDMMYNPKTKPIVQKMLSDAPPEMAVPATVNMLMSRFEDVMHEKNGPMDLQMKLGVGVMTFSEVMELGQKMGKIPEEAEEDTPMAQKMLQATIQQYIQKGLKEKTIDPVELQMAVEPLLTPEEQAMGRGMGGELQVPGKPTEQMHNAKLLEGATGPLNVKNQQLQQQNQQLNQALQGVAQSEGGA